MPPGVERFAAEDGQGFSLGAGKLAFVEGRFPQRTKLVVLELESGRRTSRRVKGWTLGSKTALSRDGRRVVVEAGKIGKYDSRQEPAERAFLLLDAESGAILAEESIGGAGAVALGHPAWSPDPIVVRNDRGGLRWKAIGSEAGGLLPGPPAWAGALSDEPVLFAAEKKTEGPRLIAYDMKTGKELASWRSDLSAAPLSVRADGALLAARWVAESGSFVLEACRADGRREALLESDGEIETAVEAAGALYAVAKDHSRPKAGKDFLAPRALLVREAGARWSAPWTSREGRLLGFAGRRLWFAVTDRDRPAAYAIEPRREPLEAAGPAIDR